MWGSVAHTLRWTCEVVAITATPQPPNPLLNEVLPWITLRLLLSTTGTSLDILGPSYQQDWLMAVKWTRDRFELLFSAFQVVSRKLRPPDPMSMGAKSLPRLCTGDAVCSGKRVGSQTPAPLRAQAPLTQSTMRVLLTSSRCWRSLAAMATELK